MSQTGRAFEQHQERTMGITPVQGDVAVGEMIASRSDRDDADAEVCCTIRKVIRTLEEVVDQLSPAPAKTPPPDAAVLLQVPAATLNAASPGQKGVLEWYMDDERKKLDHCDAYIVAEYPAGHPRHTKWDFDRAYWMRQFGFSRKDEIKGIAVVRLTGVPHD